MKETNCSYTTGASPSLRPVEQQRRDQLQREKPKVYEKVIRFAEKIKRGESVAMVQFQYDYRCNIRCEHCSIKRFQESPMNRSFTLEDVRRLSREADEMGLANFAVTGGEPLVFPDLDQLIEAIDPQLFHIEMDTNGWFLDDEKAKHLKSIGIDKIGLSLDSVDAEEHDTFRRKPGIHARSLRAIDAAKNAGLHVIIGTVVTKKRLHSPEFLRFLEFTKSKDVGVYAIYGKPVGAWEGNFDILVDRGDLDFMRELEKRYDVFTHLTPAYGLNFGCLAVKRIISVTKYGDVMPCPYIQTSLGNFFEMSLRDIVERGMKIKYFGQYVDTCLMAEDRNFINQYVTKLYGKPLPVPYDQIFEEDDYL